MKIVFQEIDHIFDLKNGKINVLVIENQDLLLRIVSDIYRQIQGFDGNTVISENNNVLKFSKVCDLQTQFVPFELNQKSLLNKIIARLEKQAVLSENYEKTLEFLNLTETYLMNISFDLTGDIGFEKITIGSIIKACGMGVREEYSLLGEKIIDYMELVCEYDCEKIFVFLNVRSFLSDKQSEALFDTILRHGYQVMFIENCEYKHLQNESRYIIDKDLCEIC